MKPLLLIRDGIPTAGFELADELHARFAIRTAPGTVADALAAGAAPFAVWTFGERVDAAFLDAAPSLRAFANYGVGVDAIDTAELARRGVALVLPRGANADAVADHALLLLLAVRHRLVECDALVRSGGWADPGYEEPQGEDVYGSTLGIVGFGAIGRAVARRAAGFGLHVLVCGRRPLPAGEAAALGVEEAALDDLLAASDAVTLHCPLTDATRGLIGARELALMRPSAILVNTARGAIVDEAALCASLAAGSLAGAGLDVLAHEPALPETLREHPRVILTPHNADAQPGVRRAMSTACARGLLALPLA